MTSEPAAAPVSPLAPRPLAGRVALVTGGARGIGRGIVERLALAGANVAVNDRYDDQALAEACAAARGLGVAALPVPGDVGDRSQVDRIVATTIEQFGRIDILVNNAAIFRPGRLFELSDEDFWDVLRVDLCGPFYATRAVARHLIDRAATGRIIMISSVSAIIAQRQQPHYAAAKAGLEMLAKVTAVELAPHGITVNCVAPGGPIVTDYTLPATREPGFDERVRRRVPLGRPGTAADVAGAVAYLASDEAAFVTGAVIVVDGGLVLARD